MNPQNQTVGVFQPVQDSLVQESGGFSYLEDEFFNEGFNFGSYEEIEDRVENFLSTQTQGNFTNIPFLKISRTVQQSKYFNF
jgi:hypothetical protein